MGSARITFSVLCQKCCFVSNGTCGSQNDEDKDDHHNNANYDHHFDVLPPVFPGDTRGCSLERIRLKDRNGSSSIKTDTNLCLQFSGNNLTLHISQSPVYLVTDFLLMTNLKTNLTKLFEGVLVWTTVNNLVTSIDEKTLQTISFNNSFWYPTEPCLILYQLCYSTAVGNVY